jgi:hypothetical protein
MTAVSLLRAQFLLHKKDFLLLYASNHKRSTYIFWLNHKCSTYLWLVETKCSGDRIGSINCDFKLRLGSGSGQARVGLGLCTSGLSFCGPGCLFSKKAWAWAFTKFISKKVRHTGLAQNPGPVGLGPGLDPTLFM